MKIFLLSLSAVVSLWLLGDFLYSRLVAYRLAQWEATCQRDPDGVRQGCREFTVGQGETALLLVHGINDSPYAYHKMAPLLAEQGLACRAMRLPGFAMPMEHYAQSRQEQWLATLDAEIQALRRTHRRVCLVAHSLGGAIAIAHLLQHPDAVDKVVLIAPAVAVSDHRSPLLPTRAWHEIGRRTLLFTRVTENPFANNAQAGDARDYPMRSPFAPRKFFDEVYRLLDSNRGRAGDFRVPLLMVLSRDDQVIDWRAAQDFYEAAAVTEKQILFMPDAGHALTIDHGWQDLTAAIIEFVAEDDR